MSIVERALQKAQQKAKSATTPTQEDVSPPPHLDTRVPHVGTPMPDRARTVSNTPASREELEDTSLTSRDLKAIVHVDVDRLRELGRLPPDEVSGRTEDEIRRLKWPLLNAINGGPDVAPARNNVILVTSALPGEGKTFTSLNLALSICRDRELRVVLVDGDVARPGLTPSLGLEDRAGLNDVLEDVSMDVGTVTYQTDVEGLFFVPAGKWHAHAPEFFAGSRMPHVIDALTRRVRNGVIIVDSPPLLATNEAQVATRLAGQVLLVVRADQTQQRAVLDALSLIDKGTPVSAVLNDVRPSVLSRYYGQYYYGQSYGYGYQRQGGGGKPGKGAEKGTPKR
jgi:Mrp family chromosome partitioning ATPase